MKNTFKLVLLASLVVFASACGKKNESGGSGSGSLYSSNIQYSQASKQAVEAFADWYRSNQEGISQNPSRPDLPRVGLFGLDRRLNTASTGTGCTQEIIGEFLGIDLYKWNCDAADETSGTSSGVCSVLVQQSSNTLKPLNPTLKKIYEGKAGTLVEATKNGNVFKFQFYNSTTGHVVSYIIDTYYHSAFQPMQVTNFGTGTMTNVANIVYQPSGATTCGVL